MTESMRKHYQALLAEHGDSFAAVQYSSRASQEARFHILSEVGDLRHSKVLDWGCGTGHLATWLDKAGISCRYTGVDIVPEFLELAAEKHPAHRFGELGDFSDERFDWVLVSGVFNNRRDDNEAFFRQSIAALWSRCDRGIAFNLMSSWVDFEDPSLWYVDPGDTFGFMKSLTPFVSIRNDYIVKPGSVPFEFAVYAYRQPVLRPS